MREGDIWCEFCAGEVLATKRLPMSGVRVCQDHFDSLQVAEAASVPPESDTRLANEDLHNVLMSVRLAQLRLGDRMLDADRREAMTLVAQIRRVAFQIEDALIGQLLDAPA